MFRSSHLARRLGAGLRSAGVQKQSLAGGQRAFHTPAEAAEDPTPIALKWWTGKSPIPLENTHIDMSKYDINKILSATGPDGKRRADHNLRDTQVLREHMTDVFNRLGVVHLKNTGLTNATDTEAMVNVLMDESMDYKGGANKRQLLEENVYDTGAPREADLQYHHEMTYMKESPKWVAFSALHATDNPLDGCTFIAENMGATREIMDLKLGEKLIEKGLCYVRKLPDQKYFIDNNLDTSIVYNYWQTSTGTEDMDQAAEIMRGKGLEVTWEDSPLFGRYMVTKYYVDTFEYDPYNDQNVMYASIADDYAWFDSWPGMKDLPHWERPLKLNYGDGEVMPRFEKQQWVDCYDNNGLPILWEKGDVGIICNYRFAHGRPKIDLKPGEKRQLGVTLGETFTRVGELEHKW